MPPKRQVPVPHPTQETRKPPDGSAKRALESWRAPRRDLLELLDDRHGNQSTVVTSQMPVDHWHEVIGNPTLGDAILDRLVHNAYRINLKAPTRWPGAQRVFVTWHRFEPRRRANRSSRQ